MLNLIKYDILHNCRTYLAEYIVFLVLVVLIPLIPSIETQSIVIFVTMLLIFSLMIFNLVTICTYFYKDMFSQNAYLTLTLPVSTNELLGAKIISSCIWILISCVVLVFGFVLSSLIYGSTQVSFVEMVELISDFFDAISDVFFIRGMWEIVVVLFVSLVSSVMSVFTIMTVVQTKYTRNHKIWWGLGIFVAYCVLNSMMSEFFYDLDIVENFLYETMSMLPFVIPAIIQSVVFYFICKFILDHMIEIE